MAGTSATFARELGAQKTSATGTGAGEKPSAARAAWDRAQDHRAAGDLPAALRWLERAHRLAPQDPLVQLTLGAFLVELGEVERAAPLLEATAREQDTAEAWIALASCELARGEEIASVEALDRALGCSLLRPELTVLAGRIVERFGRAGWCGLDRDVRVRSGPGRPTAITLDGEPVRGGKLPPGWERAARIEVAGRGGRFLGSPLPIQRLLAVIGFVEAREGGIEGWAWRPADPAHDPRLLVRGVRLGTMLTATDPAEGVADLPPLARPRRFALSAEQVEALGAPLAILDATGRHLLGSPLHPGIESMGPATFSPRWADLLGNTPAVDLRPRAVDIVIPVYRGLAESTACLDAVLASVPAGSVVHVVDDASPEPPLVEAMAALAQAGRIRLHRHADNCGFPAAANTGIHAAVGRDVVLLNSDTLVAPGWLDRLRRAAYAADEIGSATPLSNDASIVSYPERASTAPDLTATIALDAVAQRANPGMVAALPVGVGFCLYLRRDCLDQVGMLREDLFAQGYGEENDFCLRARQVGWRHVAALDVFVGHVGGRSFGGGRAHLLRRNTRLLNRLYPGYDALIAAHLAADTLFDARRRMDALRWAEARSPGGAVVLVTHAEGGGVDEFVAGRAAAFRADGMRPVVLRPGEHSCQIEGFPNLRYRVPAELPALAALLRPDRPTLLEVHHLLGHDHTLLDLARLLDIPIDFYVHDAATFCPRIALIGRERRYCGEPDVAGCEDCIADLGSYLPEPIGPAALVARSAAELAASRRVIAPTQDMAQRIRRHFPATRPAVVAWANDAELGAPQQPEPAAVVRVCVVGAIGVEKGYDVLLGCVRDARRRALPMEFVVCGHTEDDERLLAAGPVFVTGRYAADEAVGLIRRQQAHLALIPSIWPETWCFALTRAWEAGLQVVAFDLGAPAERIRVRGCGHLLPLGLPLAALNDTLLRLASGLVARHCPQP